MRRDAKVDANQGEIVKVFRADGWTVTLLHFVGRGLPDFVAGKWGMNLLIEVKTEKGKLTPDEAAWHEAWRGQVAIVRTVDDALRLARSAAEERTR